MIRVLSFLVGLLAILLPQDVSASGACPSGAVGSRGQCVIQIDRDTNCAWPMIVNGERVAYCVRLGVSE